MSNKKRSPIYKYMKIGEIDHLKKCLEYGAYAGKVTMMNDPFEWMELEESEKYRIVCLTNSQSAKLMWGHYADGHKGVMIKFKPPYFYDCDENSEALLKKVKYQSRKKYEEENNPRKKLYCKDKKWSSEKEVRAVYREGDETSEEWLKIDDDVYLKIKVEKIGLGCAIEKSPEIYQSILEMVVKYNNRQNNEKDKVEVRKYKIKEGNKYNFCLDETFDFEKECKKYNIKTKALKK